ncbi:hypothetical protein DICPUDRAFT_80458 [Dictyostelium purpureum]|uniref:Uncharacterized protein n=1 Tax=Dictyostelium purpureum TaxID=5786 RepID=F0ZQJ3_DICPU|nr:uncharacterized protein DICPUDRAFT_80458 [Dictyostelium purpureum]EGC33762.1 hypothetical protein DICPUDRAFT_80458 [Dictyostelium purpureum]|eukprot:XP_003289687.1 hypothetical protein DICPUDRAFT_80458 [Dictyostelium purpureum]
MKFVYSFLFLICISIITVRSQEDHKFNYFQVKSDLDPEYCRTHEEGDYALVEAMVNVKITLKRIIPLNAWTHPMILSKSLDLISVYYVVPNKNITTPTPSETPTITETPSNTPSVTPNETTTPKPTISNTPTQSLSPSPTPKPTETTSNNPTESPAGNGSLKLSISLSSLLVFLIISILL